MEKELNKNRKGNREFLTIKACLTSKEIEERVASNGNIYWLAQASCDFLTADNSSFGGTKETKLIFWEDNNHKEKVRQLKFKDIIIAQGYFVDNGRTRAGDSFRDNSLFCVTGFYLENENEEIFI